MAKRASEQLQLTLAKKSADKGRMYGVLVAENAQGQLGFLAAMSGTVTDPEQRQESGFVPAIFNGFDSDSDFHDKQQLVNQITAEIDQFSSSPEYLYLTDLLASEQQCAQRQITILQQQLAENRQQRKHQRMALAPMLSESLKAAEPQTFDQATMASIELSRQSVADKKSLAQLKAYWQHRIDEASARLAIKDQQLSTLKKTRRKLSNKLQNLLFKQYQFLNVRGETRGLSELFAEHPTGKPPAGAGDCAAPKLLQYAFSHHLKPICMAEFWWGQSPVSEVRKHGQFYPSCQGKCQPILTHMLAGMSVDPNPLLDTPKPLAELVIVYQDDDVVVVNKPAQLLSVPGKHIADSVYNRIRRMFPTASGSLIVHRLDMATSGLLVLALNERSHKKLQQQFINKEVSKRYIALLDGALHETQGIIELPLITDINDRPRQRVSFTQGKPAKTLWQVIEQQGGKTKVALTPVTGRTHQLRVHCAHPQGLNTAIVGDGLYGQSANRLHLQAKSLQFRHPITKEPLSFELTDDF